MADNSGFNTNDEKKQFEMDPPAYSERPTVSRGVPVVFPLGDSHAPPTAPPPHFATNPYLQTPAPTQQQQPLHPGSLLATPTPPGPPIHPQGSQQQQPHFATNPYLQTPAPTQQQQPLHPGSLLATPTPGPPPIHPQGSQQQQQQQQQINQPGAFQQPVTQQPQIQGTGTGGNANIAQAGNTTVVINQPAPAPAPAPAPVITNFTVMQEKQRPRMWSTGLLSCCDDFGICMCGICCGMLLLRQNASDMGESCCLPCCVPNSEVILRTKWRTQENIEGSIMDDCCTVWCCGPCANCQLAREIKAKRRGNII